MYLEEAGFPDVYQQTKNYSLKHIVMFADVYDENTQDMNSTELLEAATGESKSIDDLSDRDFSIIAALKELSGAAKRSKHQFAQVIRETIGRIDEYHRNKTTETE